MSGTWTHGYAIADFTRDLIRDNLKSSMGLKYVAVGSLAHHVMNAALSSDVPFVMVDISEPAPQDVSTFQNLETRYRLRVLYVRRFASGEDAHKDKMQALETIANYLQDSQGLLCGRGSGALSLTAGLPSNMRLDGMEYVAAEEELFEGLQQNLVAAAVNFLVWVESTGS